MNDDRFGLAWRYQLRRAAQAQRLTRLLAAQLEAGEFGRAGRCWRLIAQLCVEGVGMTSYAAGRRAQERVAPRPSRN